MKHVQANNKGQVLVIITLMLIGLVAMLALVLDGGSLYTHRREAQAAADAGALAGVRHLCGEEPNQSAASIAANDYAVNRNMAEVATSEFPESNMIRVTTSIDFEPFFLHVLGFSTLTASASAAARCETPSYGTVIPITWFCPPPEPPEEGEEPSEDVCDFKLWTGVDDPPEEEWAEGLYLFMDTDETATQFDCIDPPNSDPYDPNDPDYISGLMDCDFDDDGVDDVFDASHRAWVDLDGGPSEGAADLTAKIVAACTGEGGEYVSAHTWVGGKPGSNASNFQAVRDNCEGKTVVIPIFDRVCGDATNDPESDCQPLCDVQDDIKLMIGSSYYYHIAAFASFRITCVHAGGADLGDEFIFQGEKGSRCPGRNLAHQSVGSGIFTGSNPLTIEGYLVDEISTEVGGSGQYDSGTYTIFLVE